MGIKVMYLDAILAKDNITHIVNDNVMKIYYAYKHCYSQLSNELAKNYPEEVQYVNPEWQNKIVEFILDKKERGARRFSKPESNFPRSFGNACQFFQFVQSVHNPHAIYYDKQM